MTQNTEKSMFNTCSLVCWILALAFGIFVAAALIKMTGMHDLLAAVIGLIGVMLAGWLLKAIFCQDEAASVSTTTAAKVASAPVASAPATKAETKKPAAKKTAAAKKPAAKKTAAKSTSTAKTKTAAAKKPAAKKAAAKSTSTAKTKTAAAKEPATDKKPAAQKAQGAKFFRKPPAKIDDLKLISGVGPKLEATLNEIGVYQYAQVVTWKKADIQKVDDQLRFKGRIERDGWVKQAKILAKGGDTEFSKKKRKA